MASLCFNLESHAERTVPGRFARFVSQSVHLAPIGGFSRAIVL
jgi:hypothetical protein